MSPVCQIFCFLSLCCSASSSGLLRAGGRGLAQPGQVYLQCCGQVSSMSNKPGLKRNVWCTQDFCETRFKTKTMFYVHHIFVNPDLKLKPFSKHRPSGPMLSMSRNVRLCVCPSVCPSVCLCVHF